MSLNLIGMGYCHPSNIIDNKFLEDLDIESSAEWIMEKIGIETRLTVLPLDYIKDTKNKNPREALEVMEMTPTEMGTKAAIMALENSGLEAQDIGLMICNNCAPLELIPAEATRIAASLDLRIPAYDIQTACPAFALHLDILNRFKEEKIPEYAMCISTAALTPKVDYSDRSDSAILADGAAAWIVSTQHQGKLEIIDSTYDANPTLCRSVVIDRYKHFSQNGSVVRDFSVRRTVKLIKEVEKKHSIDWNRDYFVGHQANATMLEQITRNRKIPDSNHWSNVRNIGNRGDAGAPTVLAEHWAELEQDRNIIVAVVGAGLSWGSVLFAVK